MKRIVKKEECTVKNLWKITGWLFPSVCELCGEKSEDGEVVCSRCLALYQKEASEGCPRCGSVASDCRCREEFARHTATSLSGHRTLVLTFYHSGGSEERRGRATEPMLYGLKKRGSFASFFASQLAQRFEKLLDQSGEAAEDWVITYLPRTDKKWLKEGVDQSQELARLMAKKTGLRAVALFERVAGTEQKELNAEERRENIAASLRLKGKVDPTKKYLVVDDIITTGATMEMAARLLRFAGAKGVFPAAIAKTVPGQWGK